ncbi:hypothetical protein STEG23_015565 [Scotinomys teguina]
MADFCSGTQGVYKLHITLSDGLSKSFWVIDNFDREDENLWIASRLIWFDQPRPPDSSQTSPVKIGPSS